MSPLVREVRESPAGPVTGKGNNFWYNMVNLSKFPSREATVLSINKSLETVQCAHLFDIFIPFLLLLHRYGERITLKENAYIMCVFKVASGRLWLVKCTEVQQRQSREKEKKS